MSPPYHHTDATLR